MMKQWNTPEMQELNISDTENGFLNVGFEGPFNIVFGDYSDKTDNKNDATTENELS